MKVVLFDLDDTLVIEERAADQAFITTCKIVAKKFGIDSELLYSTIRNISRGLWRSSSTIDYCRSIGISFWEGLWVNFDGDDANLDALNGLHHIDLEPGIKD